MIDSNLRKQRRVLTLIKLYLIKLHSILASQVGFDIRLFILFLRGVPAYIKDWRAYRKGYSGTMSLMPCLHDRYEEGGSTNGEYFWQDLLVARWIYTAQPVRHVDIGSRVDGFVAHVASFRDIEVFDLRPISTQIPGMVFKQADLMENDILLGSAEEGYCDSLSCLHALEHFGLGRYGDPVDPSGYERGIANMGLLLQRGGTLYLSTPIGRARVEFNAHRVFDPRHLIQLASCHSLILQHLTVIGSDGRVNTAQLTPLYLQELAAATYNLGVFKFTKE